MKKVMLMLMAIVFVVAGCTVAGQKGPKAQTKAGALDERVELKLPPHIKVKQKAGMRVHMDTLSEIVLALSENDFKKAAKTASEKLGWNKDESAQCRKMSKMAGEEGFYELGMAVHKKADELAAYAAAEDKDNALRAFSELVNNCNACHKTFRH